ncbi:MAG: hypothetical protein Q7K40_01820 [bacterium]|nr:hypothetical protein [bacterium]
MLQISQLLARFKGLANNEKIKKQLIVEVLEKNKISAHLNQITISKNTIIVKTPPIIKTEIFLKKGEIINQINKISGLEGIKQVQ